MGTWNKLGNSDGMVYLKDLRDWCQRKKSSADGNTSHTTEKREDKLPHKGETPTTCRE